MLPRFKIKEVIEYWATWAEKNIVTLVGRNKELTLPPRKLGMGVIGVRRCGKTLLTLDFAKKNYKTWLYINFEDPAFVSDNGVDNLDEILSVYQEHHQILPDVFILDEIHNIDSWERWVRKMVDGRDIQIVITGSSAKLLSSEIATSIAGRCLEETIWPLSFSEFIKFKDYKIKNSQNGIAYLREFFEYGGFPEVVLLENAEEKERVLAQYFNDILLKDVISRNEIRTPRSLNQIVQYYFTNLSSLHSYQSIKKAFGVPSDTVGQYTSFLTNAFLVFEMERYHSNLKVQSRDPKKIYLIDTGMRNITTRAQTEDLGKLAENTVYLELRRRGIKAFYFKEKMETDFVLVKKNKPTSAIQVCYSNLEDRQTFDRECNGLLECLEKVNLNQGIILTFLREETLKIQNKHIHFIPLYKWLIGKSS